MVYNKLNTLMITAGSNYLDTRYRTPTGNGYDGVVRVSLGGYYASGTLLFDGRAILTAAHLFEGRLGVPSIIFETRWGIQTFNAAHQVIHPGYDANTNNDLAIVLLATSAPIVADRYDIYRNTDEISQTFTMVGYGRTGTGNTGAKNSSDNPPNRLKTLNQFDADIGALHKELGFLMGWNPLVGTQLIADFDNGKSSNDALGQLLLLSGLGLGIDEGLIALGDSGGPAFIYEKVAGVASYTSNLRLGNLNPDIDNIQNSSFGEIAAWQRISTYQQWIDQSLRASYPNAPTKPEEVKKELIEGNSGTSYTYFLLQFSGVRTYPEQILSVDYATRDGTAHAGTDYLAVSGTLKLYPNENYAVIPVEIIADTQPEPSETFYLDIYNPIGGSFGEGVIKLTAIRTIVDDDGWIL